MTWRLTARPCASITATWWVSACVSIPAYTSPTRPDRPGRSRCSKPRSSRIIDLVPFLHRCGAAGRALVSSLSGPRQTPFRTWRPARPHQDLSRPVETSDEGQPPAGDVGSAVSQDPPHGAAGQLLRSRSRELCRRSGPVVVIWDRQQTVGKLRAILREYYPGFLATFEDLSSREARATLMLAPGPAAVSKLRRSSLAAASRAHPVRGPGCGADPDTLDGEAAGAP